MDLKTVNHLQISARNRDLARTLLASASQGLRPSPWEWVAVMAFYAAVHAVNAYLWESRRHDPQNHGERRTALRNSLPITRCSATYRRLELAAFKARYDEKFSISEQDARALLELHFRQVEATVMQALGQPAPIW